MSDKDYALSRLAGYREQIEPALKDYFSDGADKFSSKHASEAYSRLKEFSERPSKRVRGALAMAAYEMFGGDKPEAAQTMAVAVELVQNYLLIIDDVMDRSPSRRGGSTVHEAYLKTLKSQSDDEAVHLSNMLAINVGIAAQHMAGALLASVEADSERLARATKLFHENILATCYGQIDDLYNSVSFDGIVEADVLRMMQLKSSYYTFINPLQLGAVLAGAGDDDLPALVKFGESAGIAFQIQDDIIGLFGDESETGKSAMDDVSEGKITLLVLKALESASRTEAEFMKNCLGNHALTRGEHQKFCSIVKRSGSLDHARKVAEQHAAAAKKIVASQTWGPDATRFLSGIVDFSIERGR